MDTRKPGPAEFHADRDQVALVEAAVPKGDALELLRAELDVSGGLPLEQRPSSSRRPRPWSRALRGPHRGPPVIAGARASTPKTCGGRSPRAPAAGGGGGDRRASRESNSS